MLCPSQDMNNSAGMIHHQAMPSIGRGTASEAHAVRAVGVWIPCLYICTDKNTPNPSLHLHTIHFLITHILLHAMHAVHTNIVIFHFFELFRSNGRRMGTFFRLFQGLLTDKLQKKKKKRKDKKRKMKLCLNGNV